MPTFRKLTVSCSFFSLVAVLWLLSVVTEWNYHETMDQIWKEQQISIITKTPVTALPASQYDPATAAQTGDASGNSNNNSNNNNSNPNESSSSSSHASSSSSSSSFSSFVCHTAPSDAKPHSPIVILANARTGSNLFFSFIQQLALKQNTPAVSVMHLYEVFGDDPVLLVQVLSRVVDQIRRGCGWSSSSSSLQQNNKNMYTSRPFATPEELFQTARAEFNATQSQQDVLQQLEQVFVQRFQNPTALLQFLHRVPSRSPRPYFVFKVFPYHVEDKLHMNRSVADFVHLVVAAANSSSSSSSSSSIQDTQFVILWRRNMLEIFVSFQIAVQQQKWTNVRTTQDHAITIEQSELDYFVQHTTDFYVQARDALAWHPNMAWIEFEYDRDLKEPQVSVVQRIQTDLLHLSSQQQVDGDEDILRQVLEQPGTTKQALVPLSQQIVNFDQVEQQWGYSASTEDWPDLFAESRNGNGATNHHLWETTRTRQPTSSEQQQQSPEILNAVGGKFDFQNKDDDDEEENDFQFICDTNAQPNVKPHQPILIVANARTGSNLFFALIKNVAAKQESNVDVLNLYEFFGDDMTLVTRVLSRMIDRMARGCGWSSDESLYADRKFSSQEEVFATAMAEFGTSPSQRQVIEELQQVMSQRLENPAGILQFIHRIPSHLPQAYFVLKVFSDQVNRLMNTNISDFASLFSEMKTQYVILWRRNMLEIFVSFQIAKQMKKWTTVGTTEEQAIEVDRSELEHYIAMLTRFYRQARDYFAANAIPYEEFEYDRDLSDDAHHFNVLQRIQTDLLHQPYDEQLLRSVVDGPRTAKQALVPLSKQIVNWNDVESWGYSASSEEWPDILSISSDAEHLKEDNVEQKALAPATNAEANTSNQIQPVDEFDYICVTTRNGARPHQPILIVANARTGSNLFFAFIKSLAAKQESDVDVLNLYEFFGDDMTLVTRVLSRIIDRITRGCGWEMQNLYADRKFSSQEEVLSTAMSEFGTSPSQRLVIEQLQQVMSQRLENPAGILQFIHRIPSHLPQAYFVLKVFSDQVNRLMNTNISDFASLFSEMKTQYIAKQMKKWTNVGTTEDDAIEVNRSELELFVEKTSRFYTQARDYFAANSIPYEEFEYDRDLSDDSHHFGVVQRIQTDLLHQPYDEQLLRGVLEPPGLAKQAAVPLSKQIVNWNDVESWGYSETSEQWPDLFS